MDRLAPNRRIHLEWVFGYKSDRFRNNIFYNCNGEIVYFVGCVGVVFEPREKSQRFFLGHSHQITCLCIHPRLMLAASAQSGGNDKIFVWDTRTACPLSELSCANTHGVCAISFNCTGTLLGSVCADANSSSVIFVWNWSEGRILSTCVAHSSRVLDLLFHPVFDNRLVTCGVKHLKFWSLHGNSLICKRGRFGAIGPIQTLTCLSFGANNRLLYAGCLSGDIYVWNEHILQSVVTNAHLGPVICMNSYSDGIVSGGKDGVVVVWKLDLEIVVRIDLKRVDDGYRGVCVRSICCSDGRILIGTQRGEIMQLTAKGRVVDWIVRGHGPGAIHALAIHSRGPLFATAGDDRTLRLWNYIDKRLVSAVSTDVAARSCDFAPDGLDLVVGFVDGSLDVLSTSDLSRIVQRKDRDSAIRVVKFSPNGSYVAVGGDDSSVDIYRVNKAYHRIVRCSGFSGRILQLDWSDDSIFVRANDSDDLRLVFVASDGKVIDDESLEAVGWASWTCTTERRVEGIRNKHNNLSDATSIDASVGDNVLAVGDSFGWVKLFRFPIYCKGAKFHRYNAHSYGVMNLRFSFDHKYVISTGERDQAIFLWRLVSDRHLNDEQVPVATEPPSDESDSDLSDSSLVDSDIEAELRKVDERNDEDEKSVTTENIERYHTKNKIPAPAVGLVLRYVFGYRGFDCRNNVLSSRKGEIIYFAFTVGVVMDRDTLRQRFYQGHTNNVVSLCLHPREDLVATAEMGCRSSIHVWSCESLDTVSIMSGSHCSDVCCMDFSGDGVKLVSLGVDSSLVVWNWRKGFALSSASGNWRKIFAVKWNPYDATKLVTIGEKHLKFWQQTDVGFVCRRGKFNSSPRDTLLCIAYGRSVSSFVTGGSSGRIHIWEDDYIVRSVASHSGPVFCIHSVNSGFVSGGKDGKLCLWDEYVERCLRTYVISNKNLFPGWPGRLSHDRPSIRSCFLSRSKIIIGTKMGEVVQVDKEGLLRVLVQGHSSGDVSGLCVHPLRDQVFTVGQDAFLRSWNLSNGQSLMIHSLRAPASCVTVSSDGLFLAVGYVEGGVSLLNLIGLSSASTVYQFSHRRSFVSDVKFSPNNKFLSVACRDGFVDIYHIPKNRRIGVCDANSWPVIRTDWDTTNKLIRADCANGSIMYFEAPQGRRLSVTSSRMQWATNHCLRSDEIRGIDQLDSLIAADVTPNRDLLAVVSDKGYIKLYRFPLMGKMGKCKKYRCHATRIINVKWTHDGRYLIVTGGKDGAIIVWQRGARQSRVIEDSDCSDDTDPEQEEGYDSDVDREKSRFKLEGIVSNRIRNAPSLLYNKVAGNCENKLSCDAPIQQLHLEHVHGYRGFDCRNNVHYVNDGSDIVYHVGRVGIVENLTSGVQSFYTAHQDDIVCVAVNCSSSHRGVVATGGSQSWIHLWHVLDLSTLSIIRRSYLQNPVVSLGFSPNGELLVSVNSDSNHIINVWKWQRGFCIATSRGHKFGVFDAQFYPHSDGRLVSIGIKHVKFWQLLGSELRAHRGRETNNTPTFLSLTFGSNKTALTGSWDGSIFVWRDTRLIRVVTRAHSGPIFSLHNSSFDGLVVSGAKETENENCASVKLWDPEMRRCKPFRLLISSIKPVVVRSVSRHHNKILVGTGSNCIYEIDENTNNVQLLHECHGPGAISGLCVHPETRIFASTSDDCSLRVWDLDSNRLLANLSLPCAGLCLDWSNDGQYLAVGLFSGELLIFSWSNLELYYRRRDRSTPLTNIKFSPDTLVLALGFHSGFVDLIRFSSPFPRLFSFSFSSVFSLDFSRDSSIVRVCTCSPSCEIFIISISSGRLVCLSSLVSWATCTNPFVQQVFGVWPRDVCTDASNVVCLRVNHEMSLVATGDKFGHIKLFSFPCSGPFAKYNKFGGHSRSASCLSFTHDDRFLISSGSSDACVMVWRLDSSN